VTAAVIERDGLVLIARRKHGKMHVGNWEFPGGTLEEGETYEECLERELKEELGIDARVGELFCIGEHRYSSRLTIRLLAFRAYVVSGTLTLNEHDEIRWVRPGDLPGYTFPEADRSVVEKLIGEAQP